MSSETKWIDWHPKVGDVKPDVYRVRVKNTRQWDEGIQHACPVDEHDLRNLDYQIPDPKETAMKYWQPRIEPMQKGWTLADVSQLTLCEVEHDGVKRFLRWHGHYATADHSESKIYIEPRDFRVIRVIDPIPAGAMTLDRVPEGVRCVAGGNLGQRVFVRIGNASRTVDRSGQVADFDTIHIPRGVEVLHILDPFPELSVTLDTLPVGRVIEQDRQYIFKDHTGYWNWFNPNSGEIGTKTITGQPKPFTVTDIIMELKEIQ